MNRVISCLTAFWVLAALVSQPVRLEANDRPSSCQLPEMGTLTRPDPKGTPTPVAVKLYVIDVEEVDAADQSFTADFFVILKWKNPRLARPATSFASVCRFTLGDVWHPHLQIWNERDSQKRMDEIVQVSADGTVEYSQRYYTRLAAAMNLRDFPFDRQRLPISIVSAEYGPEGLDLVFEDSGQSELFSLQGWFLAPAQTRVGVLAVKSTHGGEWNETFSRLDYEFEAWRGLWFYAWKVLIPLIIIVSMSWAVFWIDPNQVAAQIGVASTSILTVIAFLLSMRALLPPVPYLTRMDLFVYGSLLLVFAAFTEALTTCTLAAHGKVALGRRIDLWCRWVLPTTFAVIMGSFWML